VLTVTENRGGADGLERLPDVRTRRDVPARSLRSLRGL